MHRRTVAPFLFILLPYALVGLALYTLQHSYRHQLWENFAFACFNVALGAYAVLAYIGLKNSLVDSWIHLRNVITKPVEPKRRRRVAAPAEVPMDWMAVLHLGAYEPRHWPSASTTITARGLRDVNEPGHAEIVLRPEAAPVDAEPLGLLDFRTVFQPIFDLEREQVVGYEALTRFLDGTAPERRLAEALSSGSGLEFELALTQASIAASGALPTHTWLAVNASSRRLLTDPRFRAMVRDAPCPIVIELKEPTTADADAALRQAAGDVPPNSLLGIENVGLNHASLSIVTALRPSFVKLDRSLVSDLEEDVARQAQITTMINVATAASCTVIASGIETSSELTILRRLGVRYGQGFLLGRPNRLIQTGA